MVFTYKKIKVVFFTFIAMGTSVIVIRRWLKNRSEKNSAKKIVERLKSDSSYATSVVQDLRKKYNSLTPPETFNLSELVASFQSDNLVGKSRIDHVEKLTDDKYLLVTTCLDDDYDVGFFGGMRDTKRTYNINYALEFDKSENQLHISSDYHRGGDLKALRMSFGRKLIDRI